MDSNDRSLTAFAMVGHATFHLYELTIPLFVVVWLAVFDVSAAVLGTVLAVGYALIGVGALPSGMLADRYGSTRLVLTSMVGMGCGFVLVALAPNVWTLGAALVVWGAAASLYHPAGLSLITRGTSRPGIALAYHGVAGNLGTAFGPLVAAIMLTFLEWRTVALVFALPAAVAVVAAFSLEFSEDAVDHPETDGPVVADGGGLSALVARTRLLFVGAFALVFAVAILAGTYYRGVFTFLPDVLAGLPVFAPVEVAGTTLQPGQYAYAGLLMVGAFGQYVGGRLTDSRSPERAIVAAFAGLLLVTLAFPVAAGVGLAATLLACAALGFFVFMEAPIHQALIGKYAAADVHGLSFGYTYLGVFGVGAIGASIAGVAITTGGIERLFVVLAAFPLAGLALGGYLYLAGKSTGSTRTAT